MSFLCRFVLPLESAVQIRTYSLCTYLLVELSGPLGVQWGASLSRNLRGSSVLRNFKANNSFYNTCMPLINRANA